METETSISKKTRFFKSAGFKNTLLIALGLGLIGLGAKIGLPVLKEVLTSHAVKQVQELGYSEATKANLKSVWTKVHELEELDRSHEEMSQRLAMLEKQLLDERSANDIKQSKAAFDAIQEQLKKDSGSELARSLKSIQYQPPTHLLPHQQYTLALGYFRKEEYEPSSVILSFLTELKEDTSYQRPEVYLLTAISWFQIKNYTISESYLKRAIEHSDEDTAVHRKALLWKTILAHTQKKTVESQRQLISLVARYPHSEEVAWINRRVPLKAVREPAAQEVAPAKSEVAPVKESEPASAPVNSHGEGSHPAKPHVEDSHGH